MRLLGRLGWLPVLNPDKVSAWPLLNTLDGLFPEGHGRRYEYRPHHRCLLGRILERAFQLRVPCLGIEDAPRLVGHRIELGVGPPRVDASVVARIVEVDALEWAVE